MVNKKIYILGAGVSGLVVAYELLKRGQSVEIIEKILFTTEKVQQIQNKFNDSHSKLVNLQEKDEWTVVEKKRRSTLAPKLVVSRESCESMAAKSTKPYSTCLKTGKRQNQNVQVMTSLLNTNRFKELEEDY